MLYCTKEINADQFDRLSSWVNVSQKNKSEFLKYLYLYKKPRRLSLLQRVDQKEAWDKLLVQLKMDESYFASHPTKPDVYSLNRRWVYLAAASIVLILFSLFQFTKETSEPSHFEIIAPGSNRAILVLSSGEKIQLEEAREQTITADGSIIKQGDELVYGRSSQSVGKLPKQNSLIVPVGGMYTVTLNDGTRIWLNSQSRITYPEKFVSGQERIVELDYGEAYFDVSPSQDWGGAGFSVSHKYQDVEVLGTEFNIKAYPEERVIYTTLVEGRIGLESDYGIQELLPNSQTVLDLTHGAIEKIKLTDVYNQVSWKNGIFSFDGLELMEIMRVMERWYGFTVDYGDESLKHEKFVGVLGKNQSLNSILRQLKDFDVIQDFEIKDGVIHLK
jgi:ferric-dicitrate binding protein FerR (iron transport regulator)